MISIEGLEYRYADGEFRLSIPSLKIEKGERIALLGPSGSGKSTLLKLVSGVYIANKGIIRVNGSDIVPLSDSARRNFRISTIGFVFQEFELLDYLNVIDNVLLPYRINRTLKLDSSVTRDANDLLASVGLDGKQRRPIQKLSQGERQRVAICRALITNPPLILADEPTGNLDPANKTGIRDLLFAQAKKNGSTLIVVTHDHSLLTGFDRALDIAELTTR